MAWALLLGRDPEDTTMTSYPAVFDATPPERFDRVQLLVRLLVSVILGVIGISIGWVFLLVFLGLPVVAAIAVNARGPDGYLSRVGPELARGLRWLLSFEAYMSFLTDRFPVGEETLVRYEVTPVGVPTVSSALWRILSSLPEVLVLAVLGWVAAAVWLFSALFVLVTSEVPEPFRRFQMGLLRWQGRLLAYHASLVDVAPPYALDMGHEAA
jgi:hypothetical protein